MNTHTLTDEDAARAECACTPCHARCLATIDTLVHALAARDGDTPATARLKHLGEVVR